jgi:hypothetical protein
MRGQGRLLTIVLTIGVPGIGAWLAMPAADAATTTVKAAMIGSEEVPGPGDPDGKGTATITLDDAANTVCYEFAYTGIDKPTAAHIHTGARGVAGPPVVDLSVYRNGDKGCVGADPAAVKAIRDNAAGHYVNIHTANYPKGAIRGQLARA